MRKIIALLAVVLVFTVMVSGCVAPGGEGTPITTQEEATGAVVDISGDVDDVSSTLSELESLFEE